MYRERESSHSLWLNACILSLSAASVCVSCWNWRRPRLQTHSISPRAVSSVSLSLGCQISCAFHMHTRRILSRNLASLSASHLTYTRNRSRNSEIRASCKKHTCFEPLCPITLQFDFSTIETTLLSMFFEVHQRGSVRYGVSCKSLDFRLDSPERISCFQKSAHTNLYARLAHKQVLHVNIVAYISGNGVIVVSHVLQRSQH